MYRARDNVSGYPARLYRVPSEIERDIRDIKMRIKESKEMLNIRALVMEILSGDHKGRPESLIRELESAIGEARDTLDGMKRLEEELSLLREELVETRCQLAGL